jgi:hypothetical protein
MVNEGNRLPFKFVGIFKSFISIRPYGGPCRIRTDDQGIMSPLL